MNVQITPKLTVVFSLLAAFIVPLFISTTAHAYDRRSFNYWEQNSFTRSQGYYKKHVSCCGKPYYKYHKIKTVVAACTTSQTLQALPTYVCCKLKNRGGIVWNNTWVSGACRAANPYAYQASGCTMDSPVYGTGAPILQRGQCQFTSKGSVFQ